MASVEDLDRRVLVLEQKMDGLVGGQASILSVLRDHGHMLARHDDRLDRIEAKLGGQDDRLDRIEAKLGGQDDRLGTIAGKLDIVVDWIQSQP